MTSRYFFWPGPPYSATVSVLVLCSMSVNIYLKYVHFLSTVCTLFLQLKKQSDGSDSSSDSSDSDSSSSSENEESDLDRFSEELERKRSHPDRLHSELWFNDPGEVSSLSLYYFRESHPKISQDLGYSHCQFACCQLPCPSLWHLSILYIQHDLSLHLCFLHNVVKLLVISRADRATKLLQAIKQQMLIDKMYLTMQE